MDKYELSNFTDYIEQEDFKQVKIKEELPNFSKHISKEEIKELMIMEEFSDYTEYKSSLKMIFGTYHKKNVFPKLSSFMSLQLDPIGK